MSTGAATDAAKARRAERRAIAQRVLAAPPPLEALAPGPVAVLERSVVHLSRSRPVVRWVVTVGAEGAPAALPVIGKGYRRGGGAEAGRLLDQLRHAGFDGPRLQVPAPFGFDPVRQVLAQEEAPPTTLQSLLGGNLIDALPAVERVGHWLARLHSVVGVDVPHVPEGFEREKLTRYAAELAVAAPEEAGRVAELTTRTLDGLPRAGSPRVVTHGDFQPGNIHLDAHRVMVIDFDRAALAPAARDLGHFIGQTLTMGASRHGTLQAAAAWVEVFLRSYTVAGGDPSAVAAAPVYVARTFAEVLYYRLVVRPMPDRSFVPSWLDAWGHALDRWAEEHQR